MATGDRKDPYRGYRFRVEIDGIVRFGFRECSGLESSQDPIEYREGTDALTMRKLPGLVKHGNLSLKWGISDDVDIWNWRKQTADGRVQRKSGSVLLMDDAGEVKARWNFRDAWPAKWSGPSLNATSNDVAIESIELVHEGLERA